MRYGELDESGATSIEYAILATLIAVAIFTTVTALGISVNDLFNHPDLRDTLTD